MTNFTQHLEIILNKYTDNEEINLTKLSMDIINKYTENDLIKCIQNEIISSKNYFIKLLAVSCMLVIKLNYYLSIGDNENILIFRNHISKVQEKLVTLAP